MEEADEADGQISKAVMISEPLRVRSWWRSSPGTMSLTDVETVLYPPSARGSRPRRLRAGRRSWAGSRSGRPTPPTCSWPCGSWWCGCVGPGPHLGNCRKVHPPGGLNRLDGAPHPPPVRGVDAREGWDILPGQGTSCASLGGCERCWGCVKASGRMWVDTLASLTGGPHDPR